MSFTAGTGSLFCSKKRRRDSDSAASLVFLSRSQAGLRVVITGCTDTIPAVPGWTAAGPRSEVRARRHQEKPGVMVMMMEDEGMKREQTGGEDGE